MGRKKINKKIRILYFPLALIQWLFFTIIFSGFGSIFILILGMAMLIENIFTLNKEEIKESLYFLSLPFILPFQWWYDYVTKGEIGFYD